ncbi:MAG TPA: hypothetical protein VF407_02250 [Polyangiaceae bacterium]
MALHLEPLPNLHRAADVGADRPDSGVTGLRPIRGEDSDVEVPLPPGRIEKLRKSHSFTVEHADEEPEHELDVFAREEDRFFARVKKLMQLAATKSRKETRRDRGLPNQACGKHGELHRAPDDLRDVTTRRRAQGFGQCRHHALGVGLGHHAERDILHVRRDPFVEALAVALRRCLLRDVVRIEAVELARRPTIEQRSERRVRSERRTRRRASADLSDRFLDDAKLTRSASVGCLPSDPFHEVEAVCARERVGQFADHQATRGDLRFRIRPRDTQLHAAATSVADSRKESVTFTTAASSFTCAHLISPRSARSASTAASSSSRTGTFVCAARYTSRSERRTRIRLPERTPGSRPRRTSSRWRRFPSGDSFWSTHSVPAHPFLI